MIDNKATYHKVSNDLAISKYMSPNGSCVNNEGLQFENKNNVCMTAIYDILITFDAVFFYILMCFILMSEIHNNRDNVRVSFILLYFKIGFLYYCMQVVMQTIA